MTRALTIDETARRTRNVLPLTLAALCSWVLAKLLLPADVEVAIIPTLGALAVRHFRQGKQEEHEPKHPAVKFLVAAWNDGDFSEAEKHVAPDCAVFMNGFTPDLVPTRAALQWLRKASRIGVRSCPTSGWSSRRRSARRTRSPSSGCSRARTRASSGRSASERRCDQVPRLHVSDARRRQDHRGVVGLRLASPRSPDRSPRSRLVAGAPRPLVLGTKDQDETRSPGERTARGGRLLAVTLSSRPPPGGGGAMGFRRRTRRRALMAAQRSPPPGQPDARTEQAYEGRPRRSGGVCAAPADTADEIEHLAQLHASGALTTKSSRRPRQRPSGAERLTRETGGCDG